MNLCPNRTQVADESQLLLPSSHGLYDHQSKSHPRPWSLGCAFCLRFSRDSLRKLHLYQRPQIMEENPSLVNMAARVLTASPSISSFDSRDCLFFSFLQAFLNLSAACFLLFCSAVRGLRGILFDRFRTGCDFQSTVSWGLRGDRAWQVFHCLAYLIINCLMIWASDSPIRSSTSETFFAVSSGIR